MNERIYELRCKAQELAAEACPGKVPFDPNPDPILWDRIHLSYELFAQLIVKECIKCCDEIADINKVYREERLVDPEFGPKECIATIKAHFGVEE